jgi:tetratricopeptide (TPR) repeat protein
VKGSKVDGRSDVFSVGCMLYELMTGRRPFHSDNLMAIFYKITHEEANFDLVPAGPEFDALLPILQKALSKDLEARYPTAYDFAMDLRSWLQVHATTASGEHALAGLLDLEAPTHPPVPMTDPGMAVPTVVDGTVDLVSPVTARPRPPTGAGRPGTGSGRPGTGPTMRPGTGSRIAPTLVDGGTAPGTRPGATRTGPPAPTVLRPQRPPPRPTPAPSGGSPWLYIALGGLLVALVGAGGYIYLSKQKQAEVAQATPPPVAATPVATPTPEAVATPTPAPATAAPPPVFEEAAGKGAVAMRAAQAAFNKGDYAKAIAQAQQALKEDTGQKNAKKLAEDALNGQRAEERARRAEAAIAKADFATALDEAGAAHQLAPWDGRFSALVNRVQEAQGQAARDAQAREQREAVARDEQQKQAAASSVTTLLARADEALSKSQFDAAIQLYDEALKSDANNARALQGKTGAIGARAVAQAAAAGGVRGGGKAFVGGKTQAQSAETNASNTPSGFENSAGIDVKRGSQAAELPGKIQFESKPEVVKAGDNFSVAIYMLNEGAQPIQIGSLSLTTVRNGLRSGGTIQPQTKVVAPRQRALLYSTPQDTWKEDTNSWTMEASVSTPQGTYKNSVSWK